MLVLVSGATATVRALHPHPHLGALITPNCMQSLEWLRWSGIPWAADNACFKGLDVAQFCTMVDRIFRFAKNCKFVTIPDVVGDHEGTLELWDMFYAYTREVGLRCAFVIQDGATSNTIPWHQAQAVFLGGSTTYKLSPEAHQLCHEAKQRGLWVHVGRVNSARRERLIAPFADSFDGSRYSMFARAHLPKCLNRLAGSGPQIPLLPPRAAPSPGRSAGRATASHWQARMDLAA